MRKRAIWITIITFSLSLLILTGCGMFQGEQTNTEEMDTPPEEASYTDDLDGSLEDGEDSEDGSENEEGDGSEEENTVDNAESTVERQLYLLDANGMVAPQTLELPQSASKEVAKQSLEYLVKGGPVTDLLPSGFQAVLPAGTEILGLNLEEDGTLIVDVSKEFTEYRAEDELKIIQAMTYTLTQFDNVERIKLWVNGHELSEMPVNGTPISEGYSRANGINIQSVNGVDLMDSKAVTLYYPAQQDEQYYHVPVTQHVEMKEDNSYESIVQALVKGPDFDISLLNVFNPGVALIEEPQYQDGVITVKFNQNILNSVDTGTISDEVMETLVLTLTEQPGVEAVNVKVEDMDEVVSESGVPYSEPVARDAFVPTESL